MGRLYTIPPAESFLASFATHLRQNVLDSSCFDDTQRPIIFLPTRRACRALTQHLIEQSRKKILLLPHILPLDDIAREETLYTLFPSLILKAPSLLPTISKQRRQIILSRLILEWCTQEKNDDLTLQFTAPQALHIAGMLSNLLDQVQAEGVSIDNFQSLVPDELALHWQVSLEFLQLVLNKWPTKLNELQLDDPNSRRNHLISLLAESWEESPPKAPIIIAGSTGSTPAIATFIQHVYNLDTGAIVLPNLDLLMPETLWSKLSDSHTHPQYFLAQLLTTLKTTRQDCQLLSLNTISAARQKLVQKALSPTGSNALIPFTIEEGKEATKDLFTLSFPSAHDESMAIAMMMRQTLETKDQTVALVTADRSLARRVRNALKKWDVIADDSFGLSFKETSLGKFLRQTAQLISDEVSTSQLITLLKHPFIHCNEAHKQQILQAWEQTLRNSNLLASLNPELPQTTETAVLSKLMNEHMNFTGPANFLSIFKCHLQHITALIDPECGPRATQAFEQFTQELTQHSDDFPLIEAKDYAAYLDQLIDPIEMRNPEGYHPRAFIWGPLEGRLQHIDVCIMGGLNEGHWPPEATADPWLNRKMRDDIGLPASNRRLALSAHDFCSYFCKPKVYLTRTERQNGVPTLPSRWLILLENTLKQTGVPLPKPDYPWLAWCNALTEPKNIQPCSPPQPIPPTAARPFQLSVTQIEAWVRDPYVLYSRKILRLKKLPELEESAIASERGQLIHKILERFTKHFPKQLPGNAAKTFLTLIDDELAPYQAMPQLYLMWNERLQALMPWLLEVENERRQNIEHIWSEVEGKLILKGDFPEFTLTARADRIEQYKDGHLCIVDYKTGTPPTQKSIQFGLSPQLPLEALIAEHGGFTDIPAGKVQALEYWKLSNPQKVIRLSEGVDTLISQAHQGLNELVRVFSKSSTPYYASPRPQHALAFNDYHQLARSKEWGA